jgi:6-pyruvoyltetrahydropterin/6-carboxytetrahydropterin synthase
VIAHLNRRYHFSAAHRLHADALSAEQNRAAYGKCNNPYGHGHNYGVTVTIAGEVDPVTGMVANLGDLDDFAKKNLLDVYHLTNLNLLPVFANLVPTTENLTIVLHQIFSAFPYARLERIHVEETSNNSFDYSPDCQNDDREKYL